MLCCSSAVPFAAEACSQAGEALSAEEWTAKKNGSNAEGTTQSQNQGDSSKMSKQSSWHLKGGCACDKSQGSISAY